MCGLVGMISEYEGGFSNNEFETLKNAMFLNQFRGTHSTGIATVENSLVENFWYKIIGGPSKIFHDKDGIYLENFIKARGRLAFGHGRAATRGANVIKNAHPFTINLKDNPTEQIILVHNGTLNHYQPHLPDFHKHDVDSEWMATKIAELGPEETLSKVFGAIATMWWNTHTKRFYIYRNKERPLFYLYGKHGLILNSEDASIAWLKYKNKLNDLDLNEMKEVPENTLIELNLHNVHDVKKTEIKQPIYPVTSHVPFVYDHTGYSNWRQRYSGNTGPNEGPYAANVFYYTDVRTLEDAAKAFANNRINNMIFQGKSCLFLAPGGVRVTTFLEPFEPGLASIFRSPTLSDHLRLVFDDNTIEDRPFVTLLGNAVETVPTNMPKDYTIIEPKFGNRPKKRKINNNGKVCHLKFKYTTTGQIHSITSNIDGTFTLGDEILIEVTDIIPMTVSHPYKVPPLKVSADKVTDTSSGIFTYFSYVHNYTQKQLEEEEFFLGKISCILHSKENNQYEIVLTGLTPATELDPLRLTPDQANSVAQLN